jgi:Tol biopolymer transport system component
VPLAGCFPPGDRPVWSRDGSRLLCLTTLGVFGGRLYSERRDGTGRIFLTPNSMVVHSGKVIADGRVFLTADDPETGLAMFRVNVTGGGLTRLFTLPADVSPFEDLVAPSPDGSLVAFVRSRSSTHTGLYVVRSSGGIPQLVSGELEVGNATTPVWAPDGSRIAFVVGTGSDDRVWLVSPDGSNPAQLPLPAAVEFFVKIAWSPDGTRMVIQVGSGNVEQPRSSIYTIRADGTDVERLTAGSYDYEPGWGP